MTKDARTSFYLYRKEVCMHHRARAQGDRWASVITHRGFFLSFSRPVCADWISNCPLDRVLTYISLIYLLNLQIYWLHQSQIGLAS